MEQEHAATGVCNAVGPQPAKPSPPPPSAAAPLQAEQHLTTPWLLLWTFVAAAVPILVALLGVLARYLQVTTTPPFPALRFTSMLNLLALPTLLFFHTLPSYLMRQHRRRRQQQRQPRQQDAAQRLPQSELNRCNPQELPSTAASHPSAALPTHFGSNTCRQGSSSTPSMHSSSSGGSGCDSDSSNGGGSSSSKLSCAIEDGQDSALAAPPDSQPPSASHTYAAQGGRSLPGLAWLHKRHPQAHRTSVLLLSASCYEGAILGQNFAPGLVDPAVVMLISLFTVVGVALLALLWLKAPLRWAVVVPAAGLMIGGAAMVLVPDIQAGLGKPGSLTTGRAWLGFAASVGAMLGNALFIVLAQAFKDSNMSAIEIMYTIIAINLLLILPISLGVDGTDWAAQFRGMNGADWGALIFCACVAHAWIAILISESTVRLGGLTVSMFFGLRLIGSVAGSKAILGVTIVQTGLQVAGVVLVLLAITGYTAVQWRWAAKQKQLATAGAAAEGRAG